MKVSVVFILFSLFFTYSHAHIVIDIEPDELQRVAEILVQSYLTRNLTPRTVLTRNIVFSCIKKVSSSAVQLFGIMMTLVGANLLTKIFEPSVISPQFLFADNNVTSILPDEFCKRDFGCDHNLCWRTCGDELGVHEKNKPQSWCYTAPKTELRNYQQCIHSHECSPCWECIGVCHAPAK